MMYVNSAIGAITNQLAYVGIPPSVTALAAAPVSTVVLLLLTERFPRGATALESLAILIVRLAIPMIAGFMLGGCSGMVVAVGIMRLYRAYTAPIAELEPVPPLELAELEEAPGMELSFASHPDATPLVELGKWRLEDQAQLMKRMEPALVKIPIESRVQSILESATDRTRRMHIAFGLGNLIPNSKLYKNEHEMLLSASFKAIFGISADERFSGDRISMFWKLIPEFVEFYKGEVGPDDLLRLAFALKHFDDVNPDSDCKAALMSVLNRVIGRLGSLTSISLEDLVSLSHICNEEYYHMCKSGGPSFPYQYNLLWNALYGALAKIEAGTTTVVDRLMIAQIHGQLEGVIDSQETRRTLLAKDVKQDWLSPGTTTPPASLEDLAVLVGSGYLQMNDPTDPNSGAIGGIDDMWQYQRGMLIGGQDPKTSVLFERYVNVRMWFDAAVGQTQKRCQKIKGILGLMQQLHYEGIDVFGLHGHVYGVLKGMLGECTFNELVYLCYPGCSLITIPLGGDNTQSHREFLHDLKQCIKEDLKRQLSNITQPWSSFTEQPAVHELVMRIISNSDAVGDCEFAEEIVTVACADYVERVGVVEAANEEKRLANEAKQREHDAKQAANEAKQAANEERQRGCYGGVLTTISGVVLTCL